MVISVGSWKGKEIMEQLNYNIEDKLVEKSIEAFILGLEVYNKPTIKYRIEGFSFFIVNAWELMLKAELLKRGESIYYPDSSDTLSLANVISKIYTDVNQSLRINLEKIIKLRNTSTHFITEEHETLYAPFFQSNVFNFIEQIKKFHNVEMSHFISQNFLTLSVNIKTLTSTEIRSTYSNEVAENLIKERNEVQFLMSENHSNDLFIPLVHNYYITKDPRKAESTVRVDSNATENVKIIKELLDPNDKYRLSANHVIKSVNKQLTSKGIEFIYVSSKGKNDFNTYTFGLIITQYQIKDEERFSFKFAGQYRYSQQLVDFIIDLIRQNKNIIEDIKNQQKKITPGT